MKDTEAAFKWIVGILRSRNIPFQITGGLAARIYGSMRPLADIDIDVPENRMAEILELIKDHSKYGLQHYKDEHYDLMIITLNYKGQDIDITPETVKLFNPEKNVWINSKIDLRQAFEKEIYGMKVPVIPVRELIKYKCVQRRDVDLQDVEDLRKLGF